MNPATVIVPQCRQPQLTIACVQSLCRFHPDIGRVLIVDDGSPAADVRTFQRSGEQAEVLRMMNNRGVTAAWNAGLQEVSTPLVVFLNNDTVAAGPWLDRLTAPLLNGIERHKAAEGKKHRKATGGPQRIHPAMLPASAVMSPPLITGAARRTEPQLPRRIRQHLPDRGLLAGWCFAMETARLRRLGGFDERFRMYFSDTDLQCRLLLQDVCALHHVPGLPLQHLAHRSTRLDPRRRATWQADQQRFLAKWRELN